MVRDDVDAPVAKRRRASDGAATSASDRLEDGEVATDGSLEGVDVVDVDQLDNDSAEEGEVTMASERAAIDTQVSRDLTGAGASVAQKDARYFTLSSVICSLCGVKGHMSYSCTEKDEERCFLCGVMGHIARECPKTNRRKPQRRVVRRVGAPRDPTLRCYVCKGRGHLDCSIGQWKGVLSCCNCGMTGHTGAGCNLPPSERVLPIVKEMEREHKEKRGPKPPQHKGAKGPPDRHGREDRRLREANDFRETLMSRLRQRRYGRSSNGDRGR